MKLFAAFLITSRCPSLTKHYKRFVTTLSRRNAKYVDRQKLVKEIESQALSAQREINVVKAAVSAKQRDIRMLELTSGEVKQLSGNTKVYEGVGKM